MWQFMSAQLLESPNSVHQMEDDRESAFHVLFWVAMRYSRSHVLVQTPSSGNPPSSATQDTPHTGMRKYTRQFDEAYIDDSGTVKGGSLKQNLFMSNDLSKLKFDGRPQLDALLEELAVAFAVVVSKPRQRQGRGQRSELMGSDTVLYKLYDPPLRVGWFASLTNLLRSGPTACRGLRPLVPGPPLVGALRLRAVDLKKKKI
jgi:hypothetical protein